jgi:hypothetical protein
VSSIASDLAPILSAIDWHSSTAFSFSNDKFVFSSEADAQVKLGDLLYDRCYMRRINAPPPPLSSGRGGESLLADLQSANASRARWQKGWQILTVHNSGWIAAERDSLKRTFAPGEYVTKEGPGMPLRVGGTAEVYFAAESLHMQPGFYFAFGETVVDESDDAPLLRFYWHLEAGGAPALLHSVSTLLNRFQVPYRFKCLTNAAAYVRADCAVVFIPRRWYQIAARLLRETRRSIAAHLRSNVPLFAKPLADGLGFAEDPGGGQSFGMHRCAALARAICGAAAANQGALSATEVEKGLSAQGVSPSFPYLNPGSVDIYDFVA